MTNANLVFQQTPLTRGDLVFGDGDQGNAPGVSLTLEAVLPDVGFTAKVLEVVKANLLISVADFPDVVFGATMAYDNRLTRYMGEAVYSIMQPGVKVRPTPGDVGWQEGAKQRGDQYARWQTGKQTFKQGDSDWSKGQTQRDDRGSAWGLAKNLPVQSIASRHQTGVPILFGAGSRHQVAANLGNGFVSLHQRAIELRKGERLSLWQTAQMLATWAGAPMGASNIRRYTDPVGRYQVAAPINSRYKSPDTGEPPGGNTCYVNRAHLVFRFPYALDGNLIFICDNDDFTTPGGGSLVVIPVQRVYTVINSMNLKRVDNNTPIKVTSVGVETDQDSWAWGFTASVPFSEYEKVNPMAGPVEVELELNGYVWRFLIEELSESTKFGERKYSVRGRSVTALLDEPYMLKHSYAQSEFLWSKQLADAIMSRPENPSGYTVDWNLGNSQPLLGWGLPTGAYSYTDMTPVRALKDLVEGVKGTLMSHPSDKQFLVRSRYPLLPWELYASPADVEIPNSIARTRGVRMNKSPEYNGVYLRGENTGAFGFVKRAGTAGQTIPPMYVDKVLGDNDAIREAGRAILSECGVRAEVDLSLPLLSTTGLITPGKILSIVDGGYGDNDNWKGYARGLSIQAAWGEGLSITQTLKIERRYLE